LGCCAAAAAPIAGPLVPFIPLIAGSDSPFETWTPPLRYPPGLLSRGGPIEGAATGVTSIGSSGGVEDAADEDKIGIAF